MAPRIPRQIGGRMVRVSLARRRPSFRVQTLMILSRPAEKSCEPSELNARPRTGALWPPVRRFVVVQAVTFAVAGLSAALPTGRNTTVVELAGLIASTGLVILAIRVVVRRR